MSEDVEEKYEILKAESQIIGYNFCKGFINRLLEVAGTILIGVTIFIIICNGYDGFTDDSDMDGWCRSGMNTHTDHKTGIEYLSIPGCGVVIRAGVDDE